MPASVRPRRSRRLIRSHGSALAEVEQVRMAPPHLALEPVGDVVGGELAPLLGDHELKGQVEQQIAQLAPDRAASPSPSAWSSSSTSSTR